MFWNTEMPFTYANDINRLKDTIWLCSVDTTHSRWCLPVEGAIISSFKYRGSRFHHGMDIDLDIGDPIKAAFDGVVRYAQYNKGGFGNCVIIRHYNGLETYYAHCSKLKVRPYERVTAGQVIGLGGCTGRCYGPHLHFEVRFYDNALDPAEIFDFEKKKLKDENLFVCPSMFNYHAVSKKNILLERYFNNPEMQNKIEEEFDDQMHGNPPDKEPVIVTNNYPTANAKYHKVRSGDTLSAIAKKYGTSVDKLCALNGLSRKSILRLGQKIRIK
jgi:murein DD-endopeptidase MepM/ murein hydrolase activator NlpD